MELRGRTDGHRMAKTRAVADLAREASGTLLQGKSSVATGRVAHPNPLRWHRFSFELAKGRLDQANGGARQSTDDHRAGLGRHHPGIGGGFLRLERPVKLV